MPLPATIYVAPRFETCGERYAWLNRIQAIGKGTVHEDLSLDYEWYEVRQVTGFLTVDTRVGFRIRSDRSVTSGVLLPAVRVNPDNWKVVRPRGSQRGSRSLRTPGVPPPWPTSPRQSLARPGAPEAFRWWAVVI